MANNYDKCTVWPDFPATVCTPILLEFLQDSGFGWSEHNGMFYFYAEEPVSDDPFWSYDGETVDTKYNQRPTGDMEREIAHAWAEQGDTYTWVDVFREMARRAGLPEVEVVGAFWCDKMRCGEFGGWVTRITQGGTQNGSTDSLLIRMREDPDFCACLKPSPTGED